MVYQNTIPFGAPSQRRLHMIVGPEEIVYIAVLDPYNSPQGNLHHMTAPLAEIKALVDTGGGVLTVEGLNASITFAPGTDLAHKDWHITCEDRGDNVTTTTTVTRSDFEELVQAISSPAPV